MAQHSTCDHCRPTSSYVTSPCKTMLSTAIEEKQELQGMTNQLASLMTRMRSIRQSPSSDSSTYQETIASLQIELEKVKDMYEDELRRLRQRVDETTSCRASTSALYESSRVEMGDLQAKVNSQASQIDNLQTELCNAKSELFNANETVNSLNLALENLRCELNSKGDNSQLQRDYGDIKRRVECEMKCRVEGEDMIKSLEEKLAFESRLRDQLKNEMGDRLKGANDTIRSLELRIKEMSSANFDYNDVLSKLREGTASELQRYKAETDEALQRNLQGLRMQMESEKSVRGGLTLEKERMEKMIAELRQRIADTEGQMAGLIKQRDAADDTLCTERSRSYDQIHELELKLGQLNDVMMDKVKECSNARDAQVSLKSEMDAFKALLKEGEKKFNTTPLTTTTKYDNNISLRYNTDADPYMTPRPPASAQSPRRRPKSAHASCYHSKIPIAPVDDRVFHHHAGAEYRSSVGSVGCSTRKHRYLDTDDLCGRRITMEFQPECLKRVTIKSNDFEGVSGKAISTCQVSSFPKNAYCNKSCVLRKRCNHGRASCVY